MKDTVTVKLETPMAWQRGGGLFLGRGRRRALVGFACFAPTILSVGVELLWASGPGAAFYVGPFMFGFAVCKLEGAA